MNKTEMAEKLAKKARERAVKEREKATPAELPFEQSDASRPRTQRPNIVIKKTPVTAVPVTTEAGTSNR